MSECKVMAICNQKGGVTKSTSAVNLSIGLARQGKKVLFYWLIFVSEDAVCF